MSPACTATPGRSTRWSSDWASTPSPDHRPPAFRRTEAAAGAGRRPGRQPRGPFPRRAERRPGPAIAPARLRPDLRTSGQRDGIVLTTHLMEDAQRLSDYVYIIDAGRNVAEGTVAAAPAARACARAEGAVRTLVFRPPRAWSPPRATEGVASARRRRAGTRHGRPHPRRPRRIAAWWAAGGSSQAA